MLKINTPSLSKIDFTDFIDRSRLDVDVLRNVLKQIPKDHVFADMELSELEEHAIGTSSIFRIKNDTLVHVLVFNSTDIALIYFTCAVNRIPTSEYLRIIKNTKFSVSDIVPAETVRAFASSRCHLKIEQYELAQLRRKYELQTYEREIRRCPLCRGLSSIMAVRDGDNIHLFEDTGAPKPILLFSNCPHFTIDEQNKYHDSGKKSDSIPRRR